jgi:hypothetical protein
MADELKQVGDGSFDFDRHLHLLNGEQGLED